MLDAIATSLADARTALDRFIADPVALERVAAAARLLIETFEADGRVYSCGNGGSMCDAMHFAEELTGRYRNDRRGYAAMAISDPGHLSCVGNDYGYEAVFSRFVESHGRKGDCLLAISTSGSSANVLRAVNSARTAGMRVIVLTGRHGSVLESLADVTVVTEAGAFADRVQELHIKVLHILIELIERHFHPENYPAAE